VTSPRTRILWTLHSNGCCLQSHLLATGLHPTILLLGHYRFHQNWFQFIIYPSFDAVESEILTALWNKSETVTVVEKFRTC
jgi:hypothetical protein